MTDDIKTDDELDSIRADNEKLDSAKIVNDVLGGKRDDASANKDNPLDKGKDDPAQKDNNQNKEVPTPEAVRAAMLNEMFGDQYKTVEDVKKANIPAALQEVVNLRQKNQELETQLKAKPKTQFVNETIAKMNEFIRATGIEDVGIYHKISAADVANMQPLDALVLQHIIENPTLAGKEPQVRSYFERKYNVDPKKIETGDLTQEELDANLIGVMSDAAKAKKQLLDLKSKIKMPETPADDSVEGKPKWTPEIETKQKTAWTSVSNKMIEQFAKIPLTMKNKDGVKAKIADFALPEKAKTELLNNALSYVISKQMEVDEKNVTAVANAMFSDIRDTYFDDILHTVFERARTMTEKEYLEAYHNPSSKKNDDQPERKDGLKTEEDSQRAAYDIELK